MIEELNGDHIRAVAAKARDIDRQEILATSGADDLVSHIAYLEHMPTLGVCVLKDEEPVCVVGAAYLWPGVVSVFMFATDRWKEVAIETTRFVRKVLLPSLRDAGIHRLQCFSLATHTEAHDWLRFLGADGEQVQPEYGKNREDFVLFTMSRAALERVTSVEN